MSVGTDIVKIERIKNAMSRPRFADKILSKIEIAAGTQNSIQRTAASFAAKEAFSKALGTGMRGFGFSDISVLHDPLGKPYFEFSPKVQSMLRDRGVCRCDLSMSHEREYAVATVIFDYCTGYSHYTNVLKKFCNCNDGRIITPAIIKNILPKRREDMHKGDCGRLFVLAGSIGLTGAAVMASKAALRCGAGLITLGCPKSTNTVFECNLTEVMTLPLNDTDGVINSDSTDIIQMHSQAADCVLAGPGLTCCGDVVDIIAMLVNTCTKTLVLDADGINALSKNINILNSRKCDIILTPHVGEFARLTGVGTQQIVSNPEAYARSFAEKYGVTLVLKGHRTVVATADGMVYTNILGNPGMATGGSGDVLAGSIASFSAQGFGSVNSALAGVYIHSLAADMAAHELGEYGLTPGDIIDTLSYAIKYSVESGM